MRPQARDRPTPAGSAGRSFVALLDGVEDADAAEPRAGAAVAHRRDLSGLTLAAVERATEDIGLRAADGVHRAPEVRRRRLVRDVAQHPVEAAVADPEEALAGE